MEPVALLFLLTGFARQNLPELVDVIEPSAQLEVNFLLLGFQVFRMAYWPQYICHAFV